MSPTTWFLNLELFVIEGLFSSISSSALFYRGAKYVAIVFQQLSKRKYQWPVAEQGLKRKTIFLQHYTDTSLENNPLVMISHCIWIGENKRKLRQWEENGGRCIYFRFYFCSVHRKCTHTYTIIFLSLLLVTGVEQRWGFVCWM